MGQAKSAQTQPSPWWKGAVVYQIYPRSFLDTTGSGVGDLNGICAKLDYIATLGVDAVWLSPFFKSPMADYGYDVSDYLDVDPIFGRLEDFDRLIHEAHQRGLKIIIDQVYSHTSIEHLWFKESRQDRTNPRADWYVWADARHDGSPPNNWQSVFGGPAWEWDGRRKQFYLHNFLKEQPDLNLHNPVVQDALLMVTRFWMERGVDGLRLDAINFALHDEGLRDNPPSHRPLDQITRSFDMQHQTHNQSHPGVPAFLERVRALLDEYDGRFTVAEVGGMDPIHDMKAYTHGETRLNTAYSFDFLDDNPMVPDKVKATVGKWSGDPEEGWPSWAFSNHDAPRCVTRWAEPELRSKAARLYMMLLLALRGNAFVYQGEELGLPQGHVPFERLLDPEAIANWPNTQGRDGARTPMPWIHNAANAGFSHVEPWLPVDPVHADLAVDVQEADHGAVLHFSRHLIHLRRRTEVLRRGDCTFIDAPDGVLAFKRKLGKSEAICVFNMTRTPVEFYPREAEGFYLIADRKNALTEGKPPHWLDAYDGWWALNE